MDLGSRHHLRSALFTRSDLLVQSLEYKVKLKVNWHVSICFWLSGETKPKMVRLAPVPANENSFWIILENGAAISEESGHSKHQR